MQPDHGSLWRYHAGRYSAAKPKSQSLGVGSCSQTAEASKAHVCVPPLRNGAVGESEELRSANGDRRAKRPTSIDLGLELFLDGSEFHTSHTSHLTPLRSVGLPRQVEL